MTTSPHENLQTETVVLIPVGQCHKSPSQPRRRNAEKLDEDFVASIKQKGVRQPIVVRERNAGGYEIVFGHRRHQGSVLAKLETVPAIVREMTDDEVFEDQLIENIHRSDMHPIDEADGFKRMMDRGGRTAQQIAEKIGRAHSYVAMRLKLCELGKVVRAALDQDEVSLGVAILLARVPSGLQAEAFKSLYRGMGVTEAKRRLEETYLMRLDQAPFDVASADLVAKAGACTVCPKRTGQQRELFADIKSPDLCTDRVCYRSKLDAVWLIRKREAKAGGVTILEGKAANEIAQGYSRDYRKLDDEDYTVNKKVRAIFGKDLPPISLVRDERSGAIIEVVKRADVDKAIRKNRPASRSNAGDHYQAQQKRDGAKDKLREVVQQIAVGQAIDRVDRLTAADLIRLFTQALIETGWHDSESAIVKRRKLAESVGKKKAKPVDLEGYFKTLSKPEDVAGLGLEVVLWMSAPSRYNKGEAVWGEIIKALGINYAGIEKQVAAAEKATKKAKASKGRGGAK